MTPPNYIVCTKNGSLLEKFHVTYALHVEGSIASSIGMNPPKGTALVWDQRILKNVGQKGDFLNWEDAEEWLWPAMLEYARRNSRIKESAILFKGVVFTGKRHNNVIAKIIAETGEKKVGAQWPQGFVTDTDGFVDREEGAKIALASGQITKLKFNSKDLFSEDVW